MSQEEAKVYSVETASGTVVVRAVCLGDVLRYSETRGWVVKGIQQMSHYINMVDLTKENR